MSSLNCKVFGLFLYNHFLSCQLAIPCIIFFMNSRNIGEKQEGINKTHIIALTPQAGVLDSLEPVNKVLLRAGLLINEWPHLTLAQYNDPFITPQICHSLLSISANTKPITLTAKSIHYWPVSQVLYLKIKKNPELVNLYRNVRRIFCQFFPRLYLVRWYTYRLFWTPHISLAYLVRRNDYQGVRNLLPVNKLHFTIDTITLRDPEIRYKEFPLKR